MRVRIVHVEDYFDPEAGYKVNEMVMVSKDHGIDSYVITFNSMEPFHRNLSLEKDREFEDKAYLYHFQNLKLSFEEFVKSLFSWDPGYILVECIARVLGLGIYGVNTVCAFLFFLNLTQLINAFEIKMREALLVAFPYT